MKQIKQYIHEILGTTIQPEPIAKPQLGVLPMFIGEAYRLYTTVFFNAEIVLAEPKNYQDFSILQIEKHFDLIKNALGKKLVLILPEMAAYNRRRLIDKGINFIVPGKQLYLPELLIDLRENFSHPNTKRKHETLLPSSQFLMIYHILNNNKNWEMEDYSFKNIAIKLGYTPMAITKAIEDLKYHEVIDVKGEKEKFIHFNSDKHELWHDLENRKLLVNPVIKKVFVDKKPEGVILKSNASALPEYSYLNPSRQGYYAIEKNKFYDLQKNNALINPNENEGQYCLEVWKYDPMILAELDVHDEPVVDPLSLYLSLKDSHDERIEMALDQIIEKIRW